MGRTSRTPSGPLYVQIADRLHGYVFAQVPVYQRVNGLQIEPRYTVTLGVYYTM